METLMIDGPVGQLEAAFHDVGAEDVLLICHPHPLYQGTMNNKVVTYTGKTYMDLGINVMRFNYRGVNQSEGEYGEVEGEVDDALAIARWIVEHKQPKRIFMAGFSFGAYIAAAVAQQLQENVPHLLLIAPSVDNFPFDKVTPFAVPTSVIMGEQDEVVAFASVEEWVEGLYPPVQFITLNEATHFFHGQLVTLREELKTLLSPIL